MMLRAVGTRPVPSCVLAQRAQWGDELTAARPSPAGAAPRVATHVCVRAYMQGQATEPAAYGADVGEDGDGDGGLVNIPGLPSLSARRPKPSKTSFYFFSMLVSLRMPELRAARAAW